MLSSVHFNSSLASRFSAGGGISSVENRVKQLEGMLQAVNGETKTPETKSFKDFIKVNNGGASIPASPTVEGSMTERKAQLQPLIEKYSTQYNVDKRLINSLIKQESGFNPAAKSHAGAMGLMQLMPATAKTLGVTNPMDAAQNLEGGIRHFSNLMIHYNGNIPNALAAYNAGMGAVKKYGGIPPYKETQNYVKSILSMYLKEKNTQSA